MLIQTILFIISGASAAPDAAWVAERDALVREADESELRAWEANGPLARRVLAMDALTWQSDPSLAMLAWSATPSPYRGRLLRFADARLTQEGACGPLLARLLNGREPSDVRVALASAVTHSGAGWLPLVSELLGKETDVMVRVMLIDGASHAPPTEVPELVRLGAADPAGAVRAAAARAATYAQPASAVTELTLAALDDPEGEVRAEAARALGWLKVEAGWSPLVARLADPDAQVRLQALRALQKLDPVRAARLAEVQSLRSDSDSRVQRAAMGSANE
jgi:HEAT repeat protein